MKRPTSLRECSKNTLCSPGQLYESVAISKELLEVNLHVLKIKILIGILCKARLWVKENVTKTSKARNVLNYSKVFLQYVLYEWEKKQDGYFTLGISRIYNITAITSLIYHDE